MLKPLNLYLLVIFLLSTVLGIQIVTVPWLAVDYLQLPPKAVGLVQALVLIPNILLLVLGGIHADRGVLLNKLLWLIVGYGVIHGGLLLLLLQDQLSFIWLVIYALLLGSVGAFIQPCKESLIGVLAGSDWQTVIAKNQLSQYLGQAAGIAITSQLYSLKLFALPIVQIGLLVLAALLLFGLIRRSLLTVPVTSTDRTAGQTQLQLLASGFRMCWQSTVLRSLIAITAINGFFHIGVFLVALPLLAKQIYVGDVSFYSLLHGLFILGTVTITLVLIYRGQLDQPGRRVIFNLLYAGLILLGLSMGPTQYGLLFLIFLWGIVVGVSATLARAILQSQHLGDHRGRVNSIYQLALFGFAPIGALFAGIAIEYWNVLFVLKISAIASFIVFAAMFLTRSLWAIEIKADH